MDNIPKKNDKVIRLKALQSFRFKYKVNKLYTNEEKVLRLPKKPIINNNPN